MLEIDTREPDSVIEAVGSRADSLNIPYKTSLLESGDFVYTGKLKVGIERKGFNTDFLTSLSSGRLLFQMKKMLESDMDVCILAIEDFPVVASDGSLVQNHRRTGWKWNSVVGILTTIQSYGVYVHWMPPFMFPVFVTNSIKYWDKEEHYSIVKASKPIILPKNDPNSVRLKFLMAIPGVGEEIAKKIHEAYGGDVLQAILKREEWDRIDGIGPSISRKVSKFFDGD